MLFDNTIRLMPADVRAAIPLYDLRIFKIPLEKSYQK